MWYKIKIYIISILIALGTGLLSSALTQMNMDIYPELVKPPLAPPPILFPIVWTVLYVLMGISSSMIYLRKNENIVASQNALSLYGANLIINFTWSIIFFGFQKYLFAFIWLLFLLFTIVRMVTSFERLNKIAAYLQLPYIIWVIFAGYLNFAIYILNR